MEERSWTATVEFDWPAEPDPAAFNGRIAALNGASPAIGYLHRQDGSVMCLASLTVKAATLRETPVCFILDGDELAFALSPGSVKGKSLVRDQRLFGKRPHIGYERAHRGMSVRLYSLGLQKVPSRSKRRLTDACVCFNHTSMDGSAGSPGLASQSVAACRSAA
jgi:hypothetical protein